MPDFFSVKKLKGLWKVPKIKLEEIVKIPIEQNHTFLAQYIDACPRNLYSVFINNFQEIPCLMGFS